MFTAEDWSITKLESFLRFIFRQTETKLDLFFVCDALDEYDGKPEFVCNILKDFLEAAANSPNRLKILFSSRSWDVFKRNFGKVQSLQLQDYTKNDIRQYCLGLVESQEEDISIALDPLTPVVVKRANGVFFPDELSRILSAIPDDLRDYYLRTIERTPEKFRMEAYVIFQTLIIDRDFDERETPQRNYYQYRRTAKRCFHFLVQGFVEQDPKALHKLLLNIVADPIYNYQLSPDELGFLEVKAIILIRSGLPASTLIEVPHSRKRGALNCVQALHIAKTNDFIKFLIERGIDINTPDRKGNSPLDHELGYWNKGPARPIGALCLLNDKTIHGALRRINILIKLGGTTSTSSKSVWESCLNDVKRRGLDADEISACFRRLFVDAETTSAAPGQQLV
ncbi:hypothetical protein CHU98_g6630 [Xylaria longipes]|nr:hypothetical protein CHU98_g6630 [Xylaria longipes]